MTLLSILAGFVVFLLLSWLGHRRFQRLTDEAAYGSLGDEVERWLMERGEIGR